MRAFPAERHGTAFGPSASRCRAVCLGVLAAAFVLVPPPAGAYQFNEPTVRQAGTETVMYDWSAQKCNNNDDIPDQPARAFRNDTGLINFVDTHHTMWRNTTTNMVTLTHVCSPIMMFSHNNTDPSKYDDKEWIAAPWTANGSTVYALVHSEYQGWRHASGGYCIRSGEPISDRDKCWQNAITLASSTNGGSTFSHTTPPTHLVAGAPRVWVRGNGPLGFFQPSNIVRAADGWHYFLSRVMGPAPQPLGSCLMRTRNVADPTSWRGWSGSAFNVTFPSPYLNTLDPAQHVCQPVSFSHIGTLSESLTWSTYFKKWILVGSSEGIDYPAPGGYTPGFFFFTSDDLINWSISTLLMNAELPWTWQCGDPPFVRDPSLLDPQSKSRNFDTIGQRPTLFFTRFNISSCSASLDRDLIRIPIEFSNQQPGGPSAALAASTMTARTGEPVTFDASGSKDADGSITKYEWDLDGDGAFERDTGTDPVTSTTYGTPDSVTVTVRVSDDDGKATDDTTVVDVSGAGSVGAASPRASGAVGRTSPGAATAALGRLRVLSVRSRHGAAALRVRVPAAGTLRVRSAGPRWLRRLRVDVPGGRVLTAIVHASRAGRAALAGRGRLRARAELEFAPVGAPTQRLSRTVTLRPARIRSR